MRCALFFAMLLSACRCGPEMVSGATGALRVEPRALDFGARFVGTSTPLSVTVNNEGRASRPAQLTVEGPFLVTQPQLDVPSGDTEVSVRFEPTSVGEVQGTLTVRPDDGEALVVTLRGEGRAIPSCEAEPCHASRFDLDAGTCVDEQLGDGTACVGACMGEGQCVAGECLSSSAGSCTDQNPCTLDGCLSDGGCLHAPRECPVADPCMAAYCDPVSGCGTVPLEDGTGCGDSTCRDARICLQGACVTRTRPGADDECTPTELVASYATTCVLVRSGAVRCWGNKYQNNFASPVTLAFAGPARTVSKVGTKTCVALVSGGVQCANYDLAVSAVLDAGGDVVEVLNNARDTCWLLTTGEVRCEAGALPGGAYPFDGGIRGLSAGPASFAGLRDDGGVVWWGALDDTLFPYDGGPGDGVLELSFDAPADELSIWSFANCARLSDGVACWSQARPLSRLSSDVTEVSTRHVHSGTSFPGLTRDGGVTACRFSSDAGFECSPLFDGGLPEVATRVAAAARHECFLSGRQIACSGSNEYGQLGDFSPAPRRALQVPVRDAARIAMLSRPNAGVVMLQRDGGLSTWGQGSAQVTPLPLSGLDVVDLATSGAYPASTTCVLRSTGVVDCVHGSTLFSPSLQVARFLGSPNEANVGQMVPGRFYVQTVSGAVFSFAADSAQASQVSEAGLQVVQDSVLQCWLRADGGVECRGDNLTGRLGTGDTMPQSGRVAVVGLGPVKKLALGQANVCALEHSGRIQCWGRDALGQVRPPTSVPALLPANRDLVCGARHCCALAGENSVSCWGTNEWNELGREGGPRVLPVSVPMASRVEELSASVSSTCARLKSGDVWCWGRNEDAQLGLAPLLQSREPVWMTQ